MTAEPLDLNALETLLAEAAPKLRPQVKLAFAELRAARAEDRDFAAWMNRAYLAEARAEASGSELSETRIALVEANRAKFDLIKRLYTIREAAAI